MEASSAGNMAGVGGTRYHSSMAPDPQALVRRATLVLAAAMTLFLAGHTILHAAEISVWEEPARSLKFGMAVLSGLLGLFYAGLLVRDVRGRILPSLGLFTPVWGVVGLNLLCSAHRHGVMLLFWVGGGACLAGIWGLARLTGVLGVRFR